MKRILLILLALAVAGNFAFAGDEVMPKTKEGDKALMFTINGFGDFGIASMPVGAVPSYDALGNLGSTNLAGFGMKYYISNNLAIRGTLAFTWRDVSTPGIFLGNPVGSTDQEVTETMFGIMPGVQWHVATMGPVTGYVGGVALIGFWSGSFKGSVVPPTVATEDKASGTVFGVAGLIGAGFFPWDNISLDAEYHLAFTSSSSKVEPAGAPSVDGPTTNQIAISSFAVTLEVFW